MQGTRTQHPARYLVVFAAMASILLAPLGAAALFLERSGELMSPAEVAAWLQRRQGIYGTALNNNLREMAFSIYRVRRPEVAVMSSSRGVDFRSAFFSRPFSCVCSIMSNIEEGQQFVDAVRDLPPPRVMILGLDYWWFSQSDDHSTVPWQGPGGSPRLTRQNVLSPYKWISEGKITAGDFLSVLLGRTISSLSTEPKLGIQAIKNANGTRSDGTWSPLGTASTPDRPLPVDIRLNNLILAPDGIVDERAGRYAPDQRLSEARIAELRQLIASIEGRGTKVVLLLLPIVPPYLDAMQRSGRYGFIDELKQQLTQLGTEYYDFLDPRGFGGVACEFKDPHHGGNALYARMLKNVIDRNPQSVLSDVVDYAKVTEVEKRFADRVVATIGTETPAFREVDFLKLGCAKQPKP